MTEDEIRELWENAEKVYLSEEDYNALVARLNEPAKPEHLENLRKLLSRKAPWD